MQNWGKLMQIDANLGKLVYIAVCGSLLQYVAVSCSLWSLWQSVAVYGNLLQDCHILLQSVFPSKVNIVLN